jgi:hypothetical protein
MFLSSLRLMLWLSLIPVGNAFAQSTRALGVVKGLSPSGVWHILASSKAKKIPRVGDTFYNHDQFITDDKGRVLLEFNEGSSQGHGNRVVLGANSDLVINSPESGAGTSLSLNKGSVFSNVKKKYSGSGDNEFRVVTDNGVAGVRGTKFLVSFINLRMGVAVVESTNRRGVEIRKDIFDFKDTRTIIDGQAAFVDRGDIIREIQVQKIQALSGELQSILKENSRFEGSPVRLEKATDPKNPASGARVNPTRPNSEVGGLVDDERRAPPGKKVAPSLVTGQRQYMYQLRNHSIPKEGFDRAEKEAGVPELRDRASISDERVARDGLPSKNSGENARPGDGQAGTGKTVKFETVEKAILNKQATEGPSKVDLRDLKAQLGNAQDASGRDPALTRPPAFERPPLPKLDPEYGILPIRIDPIVGGDPNGGNSSPQSNP